LVYVKKKYSSSRDPAIETIITSLEKLKLKDPITKIFEKNTNSEDAI